MNTAIYLMRHSEPLKDFINVVNNDSLQVRNEKNPLSINGEKKVAALCRNKEFQNIDVVISSSYVRAISTAKYFSEMNGVSLNINENFGERKFGVDSWDELPIDFGKKQMEEVNFKMPNGESQGEVATCMYNALLEVLNANRGKRIVIVSHATAITFLFMRFGIYKDNCLYFNDKVLFDKDFKWDAPEVFKLTFKDDKLIDIKNIR